MNATKHDDFEALLRSALADRAQTATTLPDPYDRVTGAVRRDRRRRAVVGSGLAAGALALAIGVAGQLPGGSTVNSDPAGRSTTSQTSAPAQGSLAPISAWPVRGNLAGDKALISAVESRFGRVLFADVHDGKAIVISVADPNQTDPVASAKFSAFVGDPGTPFPADGEDFGTWEVYDGVRPTPAAIAFAGAADARSNLLVLAAPGTSSVDISTMAIPAPDGTIQRQWQTLPMADGVSWSRTADTGGETVRFRVGTAYDGPVTIEGKLTREVTPFCMGCATGEDDVVTFRQRVASAYGYELESLQGQITYNETVPVVDFQDGTGNATRITVVDVVEPGGRHFRGYVARTEGKEQGTGSLSGGSAYPLSPKWNDKAPLVLAGENNTQVVIAPGAATIRWEAGGSHGTEQVNAKGYAVLPSPAAGLADLRVLTYNAAGTTLGEYTEAIDGEVMGDPLDLQP